MASSVMQSNICKVVSDAAEIRKCWKISMFCVLTAPMMAMKMTTLAIFAGGMVLMRSF